MVNVDSEHCCLCTLCVVGDDLDPDEVSSAFGLEPDQFWRRGERKKLVMPGYKVMTFQSVHQRGGWKRFILATHQDASLHDQIALWLTTLCGQKETIRRFIDRGWEVELNCLAQGSEVLVLSNTELRELVELGVSLSLTLSPGVESSAG